MIVEKKLLARQGELLFSVLCCSKVNKYCNGSEPLDEKQLLRRAGGRLNARRSQRDVARALDLNRSSVSRAATSRALRNEGSKHVAVRARIVSLLEEAAVERRTAYEGKAVRRRWRR